MERKIEKHGKEEKVQPNMNLDEIMYWTYSHNPNAVQNMLLFEIREELRKLNKK